MTYTEFAALHDAHQEAMQIEGCNQGLAFSVYPSSSLYFVESESFEEDLCNCLIK